MSTLASNQTQMATRGEPPPRSKSQDGVTAPGDRNTTVAPDQTMPANVDLIAESAVRVAAHHHRDADNELKQELAFLQYKPNSSQEGADFDDELEEDSEEGGEPVERDTVEESDQIEPNDSWADNSTSTSADLTNQLVDFDQLADGAPTNNLNRRVSLLSSFVGADSHEPPSLLASLPHELRKLRQSSVRKMQQALLKPGSAAAKRRRRRRKRKKPPTLPQGKPDNSKQLNGNKKRDTTNLPLALVKSMQTRQGLTSHNAAGMGPTNLQSIGNHFYQSASSTAASQAPSAPLIKQLAAVNPLKQQLANGSLQISTTIQRLLAGKFGTNQLAGQPHSNQTQNNNNLMLHNNNNNHLTSEEEEVNVGEAAAGGDFSATSASSSGEQLASLLAAGQQEVPPAVGHTTSEAQANFLADMQNYHRQPSFSNYYEQQQQQQQAATDLAAGDYQSSASSTADRLAELMSHWTTTNGGGGGGQQQQSDSVEALKLSQLVAAATASGQSTPPTTNKQLIPIEIIGLDPSVTNSILYGPVGGQFQQQPSRPIRQQQQTMDEPSGGGGGGGGGGAQAASEPDAQENPQQFGTSIRHQRQPDDASRVYAPTADGNSVEQTGGEQQAVKSSAFGQQKPSPVLHIHHFHHTQPTGSSIVEQQAASSGPAEQSESSSADGQQAANKDDQPQAQPVDETQANLEANSQRASRVSKLLRASSANTSESPRVVLASSTDELAPAGSASEEAPGQQEVAGEQEQVVVAPGVTWPEAGVAAEPPVQEAEEAESGEAQKGAMAPSYSPKNNMRFVTRNSLRHRQQQQQQQAKMIAEQMPSNFTNLNYQQAHDYGRFNVQPQMIATNQQYGNRPPLGRPLNAYLRRPANQTHYRLTELQVPGVEQTVDPQQALGDAADGQGMLMVAYRPTGAIAAGPEGEGAHYEQQLVAGNRTFGHQHGTYARQTPYNEGSESKPANQLVQLHQRLVSAGSTSANLSGPLKLDPSSNHYNSNRVPSTNLLRNLIKQSKMNQTLLMHQLQASNQTNSPYWSGDDERLLAQFNLANGSPGQLKINQGNLIAIPQHHHQQQQQSHNASSYNNQFVDNLALLRQMNQTMLAGQRHLLTQLQQQPTQMNVGQSLVANKPSQRITSNDELALVMQEQALKQLQQQNQLKQQQQQQQQQVASLLFNNLSGSTNPLVNMKLLNLNSATNSTISTDGGGDGDGGSQKGGRFELTMASDRLASKFPALRNTSSTSNVRMTKHFHVPNTKSLHETDPTSKPVDNLEQVISLATPVPQQTAASPQLKVAATTAGESATNQVRSAPTQTKHAEMVETSGLDSAQGLGNLALGFIFFVTLLSFILILISLIYRRRRAIGSARCGPSTSSDGAGAGVGTAGQRQTHGASGAADLLASGSGTGRKSLRCFNNLTQRTKHLMRSNFSSNNATSNVIASSTTPSSSLKSLNQLDSSINSNIVANNAGITAGTGGIALSEKYATPEPHSHNHHRRHHHQYQQHQQQQQQHPNPNIRTLNTRLQKGC